MAYSTYRTWLKSIKAQYNIDVKHLSILFPLRFLASSTSWSFCKSTLCYRGCYFTSASYEKILWSFLWIVSNAPLYLWSTIFLFTFYALSTFFYIAYNGYFGKARKPLIYWLSNCDIAHFSGKTFCYRWNPSSAVETVLWFFLQNYLHWERQVFFVLFSF